MPHKKLDLEQLLRIPHIDSEYGFDISPHGDQIAFAWNLSGQWEIYTKSLPELEKPPVKISSGSGGKFAPQYAPDGHKLLYVVDQDGSEQFDIIQVDLRDHTCTNLTPDSEFSILPGVKYSHDGKYIAYLADARGVFDTYLMTATGNQSELIFACGMPNNSVSWSVDDQYMAVIVSGKGQETRAYLVSISEKKGEVITWENKVLDIQDLCWSPEGLQVAISARRGEFFEIAIYDLANKMMHWITEGIGDKISPDWSPDGHFLSYITMFGAETYLTVFDLNQKSSNNLKIQQGVHYPAQFCSDSENLILCFDNFAHPTDLWIVNHQEKSFHQLTKSLPNDLDPQDFYEPEHIWYPGDDGTPVPAWIFYPAKTGKKLPPAVIVPHGGPSWLFQNLWYPIFQHMVSRGWLVLAPNYRGSTGYGRSWQLANRFDIGGIDTRDVVAGQDYLLREGLADGRRIAITGRSHGGYLTMTCLTQYPDKFAGGSAVVPFLNWFTSHQKIRDDLKQWDLENMGDPVENYARWYDASPYFFLDRIKAPVQLICGANDPRCPADDSRDAYDKMRKLGKQVELILYEDEGHAFLKMTNLIDHELRRIAFLSSLIE